MRRKIKQFYLQTSLNQINFTESIQVETLNQSFHYFLLKSFMPAVHTRHLTLFSFFQNVKFTKQTTHNGHYSTLKNRNKSTLILLIQALRINVLLEQKYNVYIYKLFNSTISSNLMYLHRQFNSEYNVKVITYLPPWHPQLCGQGRRQKVGQKQSVVAVAVREVLGWPSQTLGTVAGSGSLGW